MPVHRTLFAENNPHIISYSDDKTVKTWDIPTEKNITTFSEHNDYIRAGAVSPVVSDIILSGGYDNKVNMYDLRSNEVVLSVDHGSPVEALLFLPSGGIFISAGGNDIKVWDTLSKGRLLGNISEHHKTVTCLQLASENKRLLSGSLDRHVKVYDLSNFRVVHTMDFPNSVLSLSISRNDDTLVAGLVDGVVSIHRRQEDKNDAKIEKKISFKYRANSEAVSLTVDHFVPENKLGAEAKHDKCLRKFQHSKALEHVLLNYVMNKHPETTVSVIQELVKRKSFDKAIRGKDNKFVSKLMQFFIRNITNYRFTSVLIDAIHIFLNEYEDTIFIMPPETVKQFLRLTQLLEEEIDLGNDLAALQGAMYMLMSSSTTAEKVDVHEDKKNTLLLPSEDAQKNLVVNIA
ncbi:hypothetical protein WA026_007308 [Henosepilachna vigintioctopunctata]|uniref:U3 small nucleolar RNA-associated protein 15 homolog n=1 Tax=Henosepilachna vigintioctopunctata TaxID=420089 RepID=A0AAW1UWX9_9CUCU